jgi:uncharacterized protein (TIGR04255 family)
MSKQPPVFFTVAAIRHEPIAALSDYMPSLQDALRKKGYSGEFFSQEVRTEGFQVNDVEKPATSHAQRMYQVFTPDRLQAFTFNDKGVFAYHTSDYISRDAMFEQFRICWT